MTRRPSHFARLFSARHRVVNCASVKRGFKEKDAPPWESSHFIRSPGTRLPWVRRRNSSGYAGHLKRLVRDEGLSTLAAYEVFNVDAIADAGAERLVYDYTDYVPGFFSGRRAGEVERKSRAMLERADGVAAASEVLCDIALAHCSDVKLIPNGVEPERFAGCTPKPDGPVVYAGAFSFWFDFETAQTTLRALPGVEFVFAGRVEKAVRGRFDRLLSLPNAEYRGELPYNAMPALLDGCSLAWIPFVRNPLTQAADPIKMYEALAAGLPVVSARIRSAARYEADGVVQTYGNDAPDVLADARKSTADPALILVRRSIARACSWEARAAEFERLLLDR